MTDEQLAKLAPRSENFNLSKSHVNYSNLLRAGVIINFIVLLFSAYNYMEGENIWEEKLWLVY